MAGARRAWLRTLLAPVPHLDLRVLGDGDFPRAEVEALLGRGLDPRALAAARGELRRTDAQGRARIALRGATWTRVHARRGVSAGVLDLDRTTPEPAELLLEPSPKIRVEVVDATGAPAAGVPVALGRRRVWSWSQVTAVETDDEGVARLESALAPRPHDTRREPFFVAVELPLAPRLEVPFDRDAPPTGPIRFALPATGSVEVVVHGWSEERGARVVDLAVDSGRVVDDYDLALFPASRAPLRGGRARFPRVGVGTELVAALRLFAGREATRRAVVTRGPGPRAAGATALLVLSLPPVRGYRGRLLQEGGTPYGGVEVFVRVEQPPRPFACTHAARTDAAGDFLLETDCWHWESHSRVLHLAVREGDEPKAVRVPVEAAAGAGLVELGSLVLAPAPVLAAGVVLGPDGDSVPGAIVSVVGHFAGATFDVPALEARSGADGSFELLGWSEAADDGDSELFLRARHGELATGEHVPLVAGRLGVVLRLTAAGRITGRLLLPGGTPLQDLRLHVPTEPPGHFPVRWTEAGGFSIDGVPTGLHRLLLRAWPEGPLEIAGALHVRAGETADAGTIDLRGRLHPLVLEMRASGGGAPEEVRALYRPSGSGEPWKRLWTESGRLQLVTAAPSLDLVVRAAGHRLERLDAVSGSRTLFLRPGFPLEVGLDPPLPELPEETRAELFVSPEAADPGFPTRWLEGSVPFARSGATRFTASEPGLHEVSVVLWHPEIDSFFATESVTVDVGRTGTRRVQLHLDRAKLDAWLAELDGGR